MGKKTDIFLLVLFIAALIAMKLMDYNVIPTPNLPKPIALLFSLLIGSGTLIWGISGVKNYRMKRPKKTKKINSKFISLEFPPPEVSLSYGQIFGGITIIISVIIFIVTYGFK